MTISLYVYPLFHAGGLFAYLSSQVIFGNTAILTRQFDPAQVLDLIQRYGHRLCRCADHVPDADPGAQLADRRSQQPALLHLRRRAPAGAADRAVPAEKGIRFKQGFGMTEFGPGVFALSPEDANRKAGSIGRPNFFVDARVVDDDNRPGAERARRATAQGPSASSGYFNDPEASAAVVDAEGWFHTGDIVMHDEEWYFYVLDRKKDMFISGGENIYPVEIEGVLYKHPAVDMAAVVGVPDPKWGEVGLACVVLKPGAAVTAEECWPT